MRCIFRLGLQHRVRWLRHGQQPTLPSLLRRHRPDVRPAPDDQLRLHPQPREGGIHPGDEIRLLNAASVPTKLGPLARENGSSVEVKLGSFWCYDLNPIGKLVVVAVFIGFAKFIEFFLRAPACKIFVEVNLAAFGVPCYDFNPIGKLIVVADFVDIAKFMSRFLHSLIFWPSV